MAKWTPEDKVNPEELGDSYAEGDILIPPNSKARNGLSAESARWKNGIVPYRVSDDFSEYLLLPKNSTKSFKTKIHFSQITRTTT